MLTYTLKVVKIKIILLVLIINISGASNVLYGQDIDKKIFSADKYFKIRNYEEALPLYLEIIESGSKDPMIYYRTAVSYEQSFEIDEQIKSIPYFEYAVDNGMDQLPVKIYFDFAEICLKDDQIEKSLEYYGKYKNALKGDRVALAESRSGPGDCQQCIEYAEQPQKY